MGFPLPGETLLIGAAVYAAMQGGLQIEWIVLFAAIGAIMGDNVGYVVGRTAGRKALVRWGPNIGLTAPRLRLGEYLFLRHGPKVVFFGRFTAFLRTFAALLAGATRMPWKSFLMWNGLGGICWTGGYGFGAFLLGNQVHRLLGPLGLGIGAVAAVVIVWLIFFVRRHEARLIREAERELARYERTGRLKPVMAGPEPAIQGAAPGDGSDPRK
ncbi:MAG: DedA family protein [Acetobacteraceae bacterium]|nr:DedA family protein [Acetobacteraceae bacterium]